MTARLRAAALWLAGLMLISVCAAARAQDEPLRERVVRAVRDRDLVRAVSLLEEVALDPAKRAITDYTEGAEAAIDLLPPEIGNPLAARLAERGLEVGGATDKRVWAAVTKVRHRVVEDCDAEVGAPFLRVVMDCYRNETVPLEFRYELANLLRAAGRQSDALLEYEAIVRDRPGEFRAVLNVEEIREDRGDVPSALDALRQYLAAPSADRSVEGELNVRLNLVKVLLHTQHDFDAARTEIDAAREIVARLPRGPERDRFEGWFAAEEQALGDRREHARRVLGLIERIDHILAVTSVVWVLLLGGGVVSLRRLRLI